MGAFPHRNILIVPVLAGLLLALALLSLPVYAQSGCTGDPCVFYTPTATATGTPSPTPGAGTPTAVPFPSAVPFPRPVYGVPTSIPVINLPTANPNGFNPPTLSLPSPLVFTYTPPAFATPNLGAVTATALLTINSGLSFTHDAPATLGAASGITGSAYYTGVTGMVDSVSGLVTDVVSYTNWLSGTAAALNPTETFTIASAPEWYAPALPRPMADIGWTFETELQGGIDTGTRYSLPQWAWFAGYVASMPFQFVKMLYELVQFLGPLGLFLTWLLVMVPIVTYFKVLVFIKNLFISLLNFIVKIIAFLLDLLGQLLKLVVGFFA